MEKLILFFHSDLPLLVKRAGICIFGLVFFIPVSGQTSNISGIVNTYYKVVEIIPAKACIRVSNISGIVVNTRVMIVQMKGATINTTNTINFGDTTALNEAGNYEIGTICYVIGDSVFLFHNLLNTYTPSTGQVQLVQFAEYYSANVIDTVKAAPWDNSTGTGGVIALYVDQDLTLNAPVYADSSGYSGGDFLLHSGNCSNGLPSNGYIYNGSNTTSFTSGAYKGEGVADVTAAQSGGRGAPANGGGGGNNHNNSGGGGANLNDGGRGGGNSSTAGCTATFRGEAGKALSNWNGQKIFLGGGGGAGHANNFTSAIGGGNGGGIIFIWANNLIGNNQPITAGGGAGGSSQSDGASGGGSGGTIIMHVTNYTGNVIVSVNGAKGGNSNDGGTVGRCYGAGGGGSGGAIYFTGIVPPVTVTVTGGIAGTETGRDPGCAAAQSALAGSDGQIFSSYTFTRSTDPAGYCRFLLPSKLIYFRGTPVERKVKLQWQLVNPEQVNDFRVERRNTNDEWVELLRVAGDQRQETYSATDNIPVQGYNLYRLKISEKNNFIYYSPVSQVFVDLTGNDFTVYPNPARDKLFITGKFNSLSTLKLLDLSGRIIFQKKILTNQSEISLPQLDAGIYLLSMNQRIKKLVIR